MAGRTQGEGGEGGERWMLPEGPLMVEISDGPRGEGEGGGEGAAPWRGRPERLTEGLARYVGLYAFALEVPQALRSGGRRLVEQVGEEAAQALAVLAEATGYTAHIRAYAPPGPSRRQLLLPLIVALCSSLSVALLLGFIFAPSSNGLGVVALALTIPAGGLALFVEGRGHREPAIFSRDLRRHLAPAYRRALPAQAAGPAPALGALAQPVEGASSPSASPQPAPLVLGAAPILPVTAPAPPPSAAEVALLRQLQALGDARRAAGLPGPVQGDLAPLLTEVGESVSAVIHQLRVAEAGEALRRALGAEGEGEGDAMAALRAQVLSLSGLITKLGDLLGSARGIQGDGREILAAAAAAMEGYRVARREVEGG